jgi:quercetin dioxygenase-like cupin family protein
MTLKASVCVAALLFASAGPVFAADASMVMAPGDVKWGPAPPALPPGAQAAVMAGDPGGAGFVSIRAYLPAGYTVKPHTHPSDEHVTVLSGTMAFGMGDAIDPAAEKEIGVGGYFAAQANMHHYAIAKTPAMIQIDFMGPFGITYINPADDPRNAKK